MPAIETSAMSKVAGKARSYVPAGTARQTKDFYINAESMAAGPIASASEVAVAMAKDASMRKFTVSGAIPDTTSGISSIKAGAS